MYVGSATGCSAGTTGRGGAVVGVGAWDVVDVLTELVAMPGSDSSGDPPHATRHASTPTVNISLRLRIIVNRETTSSVTARNLKFCGSSRSHFPTICLLSGFTAGQFDEIDCYTTCFMH